MAERLTDRIFVKVEPEADPFLIAATTIAGVTETMEDGDIETLGEYKLVRKFKVQRGTVEVK